MKYLTSWIALASGLAVTIAAWLLFGSLNNDAREARFTQECSLLNSRMQSQLDQQVRILEGLEQTLASYVDVVRDVFELTVSVPGNSQPGIVSIGYAALVPQKELTQYVDYVRRSAHPGYYIHPDGLRDRYLPIEYAVSHSEGDSLLGLDLLTLLPSEIVDDTTRMLHVVNVASAASESTAGNIMMTMFVNSSTSTLVDRGACFVLLDPGKVLSSGLTFAYDSSRIAFSVAKDADGGGILFAPSTFPVSGLRHRDSLFLGTAVWQVDYRAREAAFRTENHNLPSILLVIGVFFSTIIFILMRIAESRMRKHID